MWTIHRSNILCRAPYAHSLCRGSGLPSLCALRRSPGSGGGTQAGTYSPQRESQLLLAPLLERLPVGVRVAREVVVGEQGLQGAVGCVGGVTWLRSRHVDDRVLRAAGASEYAVLCVLGDRVRVPVVASAADGVVAAVAGDVDGVAAFGAGHEVGTRAPRDVVCPEPTEDALDERRSRGVPRDGVRAVGRRSGGQVYGEVGGDCGGPAGETEVIAVGLDAGLVPVSDYLVQSPARLEDVLVLAGALDQRVVAGAAGEELESGGGAWARVESIVAGAAIQGSVESILAEDLVIPAAGHDGVLAPAGLDDVGAVGSGHGVGAVGAHAHVTALPGAAYVLGERHAADQEDRHRHRGEQEYRLSHLPPHTIEMGVLPRPVTRTAAAYTRTGRSVSPK